MRTVIIDYGSGNLHSAQKAFERALKDNDLGGEVFISNYADEVRKADRIVLPGVGAFADCRRGLLALPGLHEALQESVIVHGRPFLGICVGMQLMATRGLEHTETSGLDWIAGDVVAIRPNNPLLKIPHMGWNTLDVVHAHPIFSHIAMGNKGLHAYFVHSYQLAPANPEHVLAQTQYGASLTAVVGRDNLVGVQFHPEKSQGFGLALIGNFLRWRP